MRRKEEEEEEKKMNAYKNPTCSLKAGFICQKFLALFSTFLFPFWMQFMI